MRSFTTTSESSSTSGTEAASRSASLSGGASSVGVSTAGVCGVSVSGMERKGGVGGRERGTKVGECRACSQLELNQKRCGDALLLSQLALDWLANGCILQAC